MSVSKHTHALASGNSESCALRPVHYVQCIHGGYHSVYCVLLNIQHVATGLTFNTKNREKYLVFDRFHKTSLFRDFVHICTYIYTLYISFFCCSYERSTYPTLPWHSALGTYDLNHINHPTPNNEIK